METFLHVPHTEPLWKEMPVSRDFSTYPSGSPARESYLQVPFIELSQTGTPHFQNAFNRISKSQLDEHTPVCPTEPIHRDFL